MGRTIVHPSEIGPIQLADFGNYDIDEMYYADSGVKYYMSMPKRFFFTMVLRISIVNLILSLLCYRYWIPFLAPLYVIQFFKIKMFVAWSNIMNFSKKKMWILMTIETIAFQILGVFLRTYLIRMLI